MRARHMLNLPIYKIVKIHTKTALIYIFNMSNSEEDDYMSEVFVESAKDVRPSLVFKRSIKRQHELERKHVDMNKKFAVQSRREIEAELREKGLGKKLGDDNKGFALMQKMGYTSGSSLGKDGSKGRVEPIEVNIKADRAGLGREEFLKKKREEIAQMKTKLFEKRKTAVTINENLFLKQQQQKMLDKQITRDLCNSQKSCRNLDQNMGINEAPEPWFWPPEIKTEEQEVEEVENEEEEIIELEPFEKLEILTNYLRNTHNFCTWCGVAYNDADDLSSSCPGNTADCH